MHLHNINSGSLPTLSNCHNVTDMNCQNGSLQNCYTVSEQTKSDYPDQNNSQRWYPDEDITETPDFSDACLKYISDILMEEDLDERFVSLKDCNALQETEKSLYDALIQTCPPSSYQCRSSFDIICSTQFDKPDWQINNGQLDLGSFESAPQQSSGSSCSLDHARDALADSPISTLHNPKCYYNGNVMNGLIMNVYEKNHEVNVVGEKMGEWMNGSRGKKNHHVENEGYLEERSSKISASNDEEYEEMEKFDDVLICKEGNDDISPCTSKSAVNQDVENLNEEGKSRRSRSKNKSSGTKKSNKLIDLRSLLTQCAQAVASFELTNANELLKQVRLHANQFGDNVERVAHYFANGLQARLAGVGSDSYKDLQGMRISNSDILKGYKLYVSHIPFQRTSYFLANQTIVKLASKAKKIHIIDFGIFFGFQWPCLIQSLSKRPLGPPRLRITGVDYPTSGFKPAQKVEETGLRLQSYCQRFGVPFTFHAIAQRWHTLKPENFNIEKDELVIVTCLYQSRRLPDETVDGNNSPRDHFLRLIKTLNPHLFIHGVVNGTFNAPFFITRFREALYHYSSLFDVFDAVVPREDEERLLIEKYLYGRAVLNIVACEGSERIERPESYKQWLMRQHRAGFKQVPLDMELVKKAKATVKAKYHKDFMLEQDQHWIVQGWKGRILSAISCWKPA